MAKKKEEAVDEGMLDDPEVEEEATEPERTYTEATEEGVYVVDSEEIAIKNQTYHKGDKVNLTPEELDSVQAVGVRILPVE